MANEQQLEPCLCNGKSVSRMFNPKQLRIYPTFTDRELITVMS